MTIVIQSKSGDYNAEVDVNANGLAEALGVLRRLGGYYAWRRSSITGEEEIFVPFEQIEFIAKKILVN